MSEVFFRPLEGVDGLVVLALISGVLSVFRYLPYILDTVRRHTQPDRASWLIWSVMSSISFFSLLYEGATVSLVFTGAQVSGTLIVCALSVNGGAGSYVSRKNLGLLGGALAGLVAWYLTDTAVYSLAISISISLLGGLSTVQKAYRAPESETLTTWGMGWVASILAVLSVGQLNPILLAYPVYLLVLDTAITAAIILGRMRDARRRRVAWFEHRPLRRPLVLTPQFAVRPLAPKGHIFDQVSQLAPQKNMQVPTEYEYVQNDNHGYYQS
jgi:hypothetical protein